MVRKKTQKRKTTKKRTIKKVKVKKTTDKVQSEDIKKNKKAIKDLEIALQFNKSQYKKHKNRKTEKQSKLYNEIERKIGLTKLKNVAEKKKDKRLVQYLRYNIGKRLKQRTPIKKKDFIDTISRARIGGYTPQSFGLTPSLIERLFKSSKEEASVGEVISNAKAEASAGLEKLEGQIKQVKNLKQQTKEFANKVGTDWNNLKDKQDIESLIDFLENIFDGADLIKNYLEFLKNNPITSSITATSLGYLAWLNKKVLAMLKRLGNWGVSQIRAMFGGGEDNDDDASDSGGTMGGRGDRSGGGGGGGGDGFTPTDTTPTAPPQPDTTPTAPQQEIPVGQPVPLGEPVDFRQDFQNELRERMNNIRTPMRDVNAPPRLREQVPLERKTNLGQPIQQPIEITNRFANYAPSLSSLATLGVMGAGLYGLSKSFDYVAREPPYPPSADTPRRVPPSPIQERLSRQDVRGDTPRVAGELRQSPVEQVGSEPMREPPPMRADPSAGPRDPVARALLGLPDFIQGEPTRLDLGGTPYDQRKFQARQEQLEREDQQRITAERDALKSMVDRIKEGQQASYMEKQREIAPPAEEEVLFGGEV